MLHRMVTHFLPPANEVWGKVIFLHLSVILFTGGVPGQPLGKYIPSSACWDTVNKRAARILLECILFPCRFSVNKSGNEYQGSFYFLVDEVRYANKDLYVGSDVHPSGSATINVELRAGQLVRIENYGSTVIFGTSDDEEGEMYSWFTGHLLYAL